MFKVSDKSEKMLKLLTRLFSIGSTIIFCKNVCSVKSLKSGTPSKTSLFSRYAIKLSEPHFGRFCRETCLVTAGHCNTSKFVALRSLVKLVVLPTGVA